LTIGEGVLLFLKGSLLHLHPEKETPGKNGNSVTKISVRETKTEEELE